MTEKYTLYLNEKPYGRGSLDYMKELIDDWLICDMYGESSTDFQIRLIQTEVTE